jgi:hypothetical protein
VTKNRIGFLDMYFEKEKSIMIKHYYHKIKKHKKAKTIYNKLAQIANDTKTNLLTVYYSACKLKFTVAFFEQKLEENS